MANAVYSVLERMAGGAEPASSAGEAGPSAKRAKTEGSKPGGSGGGGAYGGGGEARGLLAAVAAAEVTAATLAARLTEHIERIDTDAVRGPRARPAHSPAP